MPETGPLTHGPELAVGVHHHRPVILIVDGEVGEFMSSVAPCWPISMIFWELRMAIPLWPSSTPITLIWSCSIFGCRVSTA